MNVFEEQFAALKDEFPAALYTPVSDGSYTVTIPDFPLPTGWSSASSTVRFIAPIGYPISRPDCFWCDATLRLAGGGPPQNTGANPMPNGPAPLLWFSWHVSNWSPNGDTLRTYLRVIEKRFYELK